MAAKYILAALSAVIFWRSPPGVSRQGWRQTSHSQTRTWLLIGVIFGAVACGCSRASELKKENDSWATVAHQDRSARRRNTPRR